MKLSFSLLKRTVLAAGLLVGSSLSAAPFAFTTGNPDGKMGAASRRASPGKLETETADDFPLAATTVLTKATITGLIPPGTPLANIKQVEVELYHVFSTDSAVPPSGNVPSRQNSPSDVEIESATRSTGSGTLAFSATVLNGNFTVANTVVNGINKFPNTIATNGEGSAIGEAVEITITFTTPIVLPAGHYFFRPEVLLTNGDFLYLSAPRPVAAPGTPFAPDFQAWIRNSNLAPDWLRIGTDIIGGTTPPTFNMTFSLTGDTVPLAGTPGTPDCHGTTVSGLTQQFGSIDSAAATLQFPSVQSLQDRFRVFCEQ